MTDTLNRELLRDLVMWAAQDATELEKAAAFLDWGGWNQASWAEEIRNDVCHSSYCIAGQAVTQAGYGLSFYKEDVDPQTGYTTWGADNCAPMIPQTDEHGEVVLDSKGKPIMVLDRDNLRTISRVATEVLGITEDEAERLFEGDNQIGDIVQYATEIAEAHDVELDLPDDIRVIGGLPVSW